MLKNARHQGNRGVALIIALLLLLILTLIGIFSLDASRQEIHIVGNQRIYHAAFYAAESGLDEFRASAPPTEDQVPFTPPKRVGSSESTYRYKAERLGTRQTGGAHYVLYKVTSEGTAPAFPNAGRVILESIIEITAEGAGGGGAVDETGKYN
jgi:Tfp pilus assembly protein PilX